MACLAIHGRGIQSIASFCFASHVRITNFQKVRQAVGSEGTKAKEAMEASHEVILCVSSVAMHWSHELAPHLETSRWTELGAYVHGIMKL